MHSSWIRQCRRPALGTTGHTELGGPHESGVRLVRQGILSEILEQSLSRAGVELSRLGRGHHARLGWRSLDAFDGQRDRGAIESPEVNVETGAGDVLKAAADDAGDRDELADVDRRDYDVEYYLRQLRDTFASRLARGLTPDDFAAVTADPQQYSLFEASLSESRAILTVLSPAPSANALAGDGPACRRG